MLKVIIVDDEELAIERLSDLLAESGGVEILETFAEPESAFQYLQNQRADAAFLDISLPGYDGLQLADAIMNIQSDLDVVFVTGYDEYAVKAFELNAVDYLLKPVSKERLEKTIVNLTKIRMEKLILEKLRKENMRPETLPMEKIHPEVEGGGIFEEGDIKDCESRATLTEIHCLGKFQLLQGGERLSIRWRTAKTEELFAFLLCFGRTPVSRDSVMESLWPESDPQKAMDMLNVTTYNLRKSLNSIGMKDCIKSSRSSLWIEGDFFTCDVNRFEEILKEFLPGRAHSIREMERAINFYQGDYLEEKDYLWAQDIREEMKKAFLKILEEVSELYFNDGMTAPAIDSLKRILASDPLKEEIHEKLIRLYLHLGNRVEAERQYRLLKELLLRELGIEPDKGIKKLLGNQ